ncbi:hypothetical protein M427DRAFT_30358 [Gonapodya prolifera JEL478]|uniref:Uncharacterized protein n=1 Tax=Gonapodya prolifera (strain JEL478) TaxID=1344416 RepID=A0A139AL76_GONPJ|nr:hypothetical protein M427DRAFT_30358 [Gonapodya prolifera JEL478]|eukprot:KXS17547.1 hypothetical protein M427DRAFT_30358 [Gonapodya prolifera JEL478]
MASKEHSTHRQHPEHHERSHEENQERSFIAAAHRGDRDHDARLESAHKASDIHKARTGKELDTDSILSEGLIIEKKQKGEKDDDVLHEMALEEGYYLRSKE